MTCGGDDQGEGTILVLCGKCAAPLSVPNDRFSLDCMSRLQSPDGSDLTWMAVCSGCVSEMT